MRMNIASFQGPLGRCNVSANQNRERERGYSKGRESFLSLSVFSVGGQDDNNEEWDAVVRETEGGRVQGRAVVSRSIGQGCGGCGEAQMGRTLPLRNRNAQTPARAQRHTRSMCTLLPQGRSAFSDRCGGVSCCVVARGEVAEEGRALPVADLDLEE